MDRLCEEVCDCYEEEEYVICDGGCPSAFPPGWLCFRCVINRVISGVANNA